MRAALDDRTDNSRTFGAPVVNKKREESEKDGA